MNRRSDQEALLADVLAEDGRAGWNRALLEDTLRHVRRQRRWRRTGGAAGLIVMLLVAGVAFWKTTLRDEPRLAHPAPAPAASPYQLVITRPLAPSQVVLTQPFSAGHQILAAWQVSIVRTRPGGTREVGDDELLALAAPQIVALVRRGPHDAELVFVHAPPDASRHEN